MNRNQGLSPSFNKGGLPTGTCGPSGSLNSSDSRLTRLSGRVCESRDGAGVFRAILLLLLNSMKVDQPVACSNLG